MIAGTILFAICALLCVTGAAIVVLAKNPIRSAMGLLTTIFGIAGLFLRLNAEFLAAMQILVYAGAVVILFVFVVMLLGPNASIGDRGRRGATVSRLVAAALVGLFGLGAVVLFAGGSVHEFQTIGTAHGSVEAVGRLLFSEGLVAFELATVLLIVAVVGAIGVARTKPSSKKPARQENPSSRMYNGPLHVRDAEHPLTGKSLAIASGKESA